MRKGLLFRIRLHQFLLHIKKCCIFALPFQHVKGVQRHGLTRQQIALKDLQSHIVRCGSCFIKGLHGKPLPPGSGTFYIIVLLVENFSLDHSVRVFPQGNLIGSGDNQRNETKISLRNIGVLFSSVLHS